MRVSFHGTLFLVIAGCALICPVCNGQVVGFGLSETAKPDSENVDEKASETILDIIESMDLRDRISQLMFVKLKGVHGPTAEDKHLLEDYSPGGIILPAIVDHTATADYVKQIRTMAQEKNKGIALFITASLQGHHRDTPLKENVFRNLPSPMTMAAAYNGKCTQHYIEKLAGQLKEVGLNTYLGPSLELAPALPNAINTTQCFGSEPASVADIGAACIQTLMKSDLLVMPTGFPGGGTNRLEKTEAVLLTPSKALQEKDLLPYMKAIENETPLIHVGNTLVPTIDSSSVPACLSKKVITTILRQGLGFEGIIVAGPVDRWDIGKNRSSTQAAIMAMRSGADMLYWGEGGIETMRAVEEILFAVKKDELSESDINASLTRILTAKKEHKLLEHELPEIKANKKRKNAQELSDETTQLEKLAVTLVKNRGEILPLSKESSLPLGVTGTTGVEELHDALEEYIEPIAQQAILTARHLGDIQDFEIMRIISRAKGVRTVICVFENMQKTSGQVKLVKELKAKGARIIVVLLGYPSNLPVLSAADAIVLAYGPATSEKMKAIADILVGQSPIRMLPDAGSLRTYAGNVESLDVRNFVCAPNGRLPVTINESYPAGHYVSYDLTSSIEKVQWSFSDGQILNDLTVKHHFSEAGTDTFTLTIVDKEKSEIFDTYNVLVKPAQVHGM